MFNIIINFSEIFQFPNFLSIRTFLPVLENFKKERYIKLETYNGKMISLYIIKGILVLRKVSCKICSYKMA